MWIKLDPAEVELVKNSLAIANTATPSFVQGALALLEKVAKAQEVDEADAIFIEKARDLYADDECEIDDDPATSAGDEGRWVAAWVWVSNDDVEACEQCGAIPGTSEYGTVGDGYAGLCPSCADATEAEEVDDADDPEYRGQGEDDE